MAYSIAIAGTPAKLIDRLRSEQAALEADQARRQDAADLKDVLPGVVSILEANVDASKGWVMRVEIVVASTVDQQSKAGRSAAAA